MKLARLTMLSLAVMLMLSMTSCTTGNEKTTDLEVLYVQQAYLCPPTLPEMAQNTDDEARVKAMAKASIPLQDVWIVPTPTFRWMMKQIAKLKRIEAEGQ